MGESIVQIKTLATPPTCTGSNPVVSKSGHASILCRLMPMPIFVPQILRDDWPTVVRVTAMHFGPPWLTILRLANVLPSKILVLCLWTRSYFVFGSCLTCICNKRILHEEIYNTRYNSFPMMQSNYVQVLVPMFPMTTCFVDLPTLRQMVHCRTMLSVTSMYYWPEPWDYTWSLKRWMLECGTTRRAR